MNDKEEDQISSQAVESNNQPINKVKLDERSDKESSEPNKNDKEKNTKLKKEKTPGVIYLSRIPTKMNVKLIREYFSNIGQVGRVYLEPRPDDKKRKNHPTSFIEGWVEFKNKRDAKIAAKKLNNNQVGGRRRNPWYHELWNIKYLKGFRWAHLNERLVYEQEMRKQRLRQEVALAKKETNFYIQNFEKSENRKRMEKRMQRKQEKNDTNDDQNNASTSTEKNSEESNKAVKKTDDQDGTDHYHSKKRQHPLFERKVKVADNETFLKQIFSFE